MKLKKIKNKIQNRKFLCEKVKRAIKFENNLNMCSIDQNGFVRVLN